MIIIIIDNYNFKLLCNIILLIVSQVRIYKTISKEYESKRAKKILLFTT